MNVNANLSTLTREQLEAMVIDFQSQPKRKLPLKVSAKGAISLYGMGKFPVTLYKQQWLKVLDQQEEIREFITTNDTLLSVKA